MASGLDERDHVCSAYLPHITCIILYLLSQQEEERKQCETPRDVCEDLLYYNLVVECMSCFIRG